ncbi:SDR family oxidoreductase [Lysobacter enzymogenes]|nr:SDR family oxidoreductase [Lysobacter enzymogenes]QCW26128.1 SDR family oxidoreductase [Lysobacter enzymogenes]
MSAQTALPTPAALVTGASRGIGRAIALRLAADGFAVAVNYASNVAAADAVVAEIESAGVAPSRCRTTSPTPTACAVFATAKAAFGRLDAVVNSAGVMPYVPVQGGDLAEFDRVIATNLRGSYIVLGLAAEHLGDGGRIVALSTSVIGKAFPNYGPYIASKAGVEGLVHVLANELRGRNITVNAVAPGPVATELFLNGKTPEQIAHFQSLAPLERLGAPEEIAAAVAFLVGRDGSWVNSQVLRVNGGYIF